MLSDMPGFILYFRFAAIKVFQKMFRFASVRSVYVYAHTYTY